MRRVNCFTSRGTRAFDLPPRVERVELNAVMLRVTFGMDLFRFRLCRHISILLASATVPPHFGTDPGAGGVLGKLTLTLTFEWHPAPLEFDLVSIIV